MRRLMLLVVPGVMICCDAVAQGPPPDKGRQEALLKKYDKDGDGKLSESEIAAASPAAAQKPAAGPGNNSQQPVRAGTTADAVPVNDRLMQALLEKFDVNGDGKLDLDEMAALRAFARNESSKTNHTDAAGPGAGR